MTTAAEEYADSSAHRFHHQLINDREYLFRLSSTFAWEESIEFCNACIFHVEQAAAAATTDNNDNNNSSSKIEYYDENPHKHTTSLHTKIQSLSLQQYIQYIQRQLNYIDQWGNTCLHAQCFCKPPVESVNALFRLARLLRRFSLCDTNDNDNEMMIIWATTCKDGSTPFHIAASTGASPDVLHCYISEIQYYIDQKWLPLNLNNNNVLYSEEWARKTILRPDLSGNTPLMGWMSHHYKWIKYQLDNLSSGIFTMSSTPYLLSNYWDLAERMIRFATTITMVENNENENDSHSVTTTTSTTVELMQQCASISMYCPVSLLEWIVSPNRNGRRCDNTIETSSSSSSSSWAAADVCAATPNETTGKLLFHVAMEAQPFQFDSCSSSGRKEVLRYTTNNPRLEMNRIQILKKLLIWYPHAANVPFRLMKSVAAISTVAADKKQQDHNNNNVVVVDDEKKRIVRSRSPFLQAIAFGGSWWCTIKADDCSNNQRGGGGTIHDENDDVDNYMGLVQLLWRMNHHPGEIISKRDEVTGLYPFMLAGASSCDVDNSDDDATVVDTTYNLLRKDPQLVAGALSYGK